MKNKTSGIIFTILTILFSVSVFFVFKFSSIPPLEFLPDSVKKLLQKPIHNTSDYEVFRLLENLSLAFITAYIVYLLIDFIPNYFARRKAFVIYKNRITNIYLEMSVIIGGLKMLADIKKENKKIMKSDLEKLNTYNPEYEKTYYKSFTQLSDKKKNKSFTRGVFIYHQRLSDEAKGISKNIENIIKLPIATKLDYNLLELLSSIESSPFLSYCKQLSDMRLKGSMFTNDSFNEELFDFIQLHLKLEKYNFRKHSYRFEKLRKDEIIELEQIRNKVIENVPFKNGKFYLGGIEYILKDGELN